MRFIKIAAIILIVIVIAVVIFQLVNGNSPVDFLSNLRPERDGPSELTQDLETPQAPPATQEPLQIATEQTEPASEPSPSVPVVPVVIAVRDLPAGTKLTTEMLNIEQRPEANVAVVAGITFADQTEIAGKYLTTGISQGQEIIEPMLSDNPGEFTAMGSNLSLFIDEGDVAMALPIDALSGAAFAIRPGDFVDVYVSLAFVELDESFQTVLPNYWQRVFEPALQRGRPFLTDPVYEGRLELESTTNNVAVVSPGEDKVQIPRRITQLALQKIQVLAVNGEDTVVLNLPPQDGLALTWAVEAGLDIDLVLRNPGDETEFSTTAVSFPQIMEQGIITPPEPMEYGLEPRIDRQEPLEPAIQHP